MASFAPTEMYGSQQPQTFSSSNEMYASSQQYVFKYLSLKNDIEKTVVISSLQQGVTEEILKNVFETIEPTLSIRDTKIVRESKDRSKVYGFVTYATEEDAQKIINNTKGTWKYEEKEWNLTKYDSINDAISIYTPALLQDAEKSFFEKDYLNYYSKLKSTYESNASSKQNVDLLWRLARACLLQASSLQRKNPKKKELLQEGQEYALAAHKIDNKNFIPLYFLVLNTNHLITVLSIKEKIQQGYQFKEYLDKALTMQTEYSLLHMRGRFSYSVATLTWWERKAASAFFATPPSATIDDALKDFLEVEKVRPKWIENLLYVAKCFIKKGDKANAAKYLNQAVPIEAQDDADSEALEEAKQLLAKHGK